MQTTTALFLALSIPAYLIGFVILIAQAQARTHHTYVSLPYINAHTYQRKFDQTSGPHTTIWRPVYDTPDLAAKLLRFTLVTFPIYTTLFAAVVVAVAYLINLIPPTILPVTLIFAPFLAAPFMHKRTQQTR